MNAMMQTVKGLGTVKSISLVAVGLVLLGVFFLIITRISAPVLSPIYTNLSMEDGGDIIGELEQMGIPYDVAANGTQVLVPNTEVLRLRLVLAQKGLPSQGSVVGYEIFDKSDALGTSDFVHNVNLLRALEGELSRTIGSFEAIENARVHLVMPKKQIFNRNNTIPSASVVLSLKNRSTKLSKEQTGAITHLVASAVPGLQAAGVTIVDSAGKLLAKGEGEDEEGGLMVSEETSEFQANYEKRMKMVLEKLLEQSVGSERVKVEVTAEMAFDRVVTNSEIYDPDGQVVRSIQTSEEKGSSLEGDQDSVSVANNLPDSLPNSPLGSTSQSSTEKIDETTNFEISKTVTNHISEIGNVKKLSIAVLVDGTYAYDEEAQSNIYSPRSEEEIEKLETLVKSAAGFDAERGDVIKVVNMPFYRGSDEPMVDEDALGWLKRDLHNILKTVVVGVVAVLTILLVIRPLVVRAFDMSPAEASSGGPDNLVSFRPEDEDDFDEDEDSIDLDQIQQRMQSSSIKKVNELVGENPSETLHVIRNWLSQKG